MSRSVPLRRRLGLLPALALLLCGCGPCRTNASVEEAAREYLADRYGEDFVITRLRRQTGTYGEPKPFTGTFPFRASPVARPEVVVQGRVSHDELGRRTFWDDYACTRVREWLLPGVRGSLGPRRRLVEPRVVCSYDLLPSEARPPLPDGAVTLRANLQTFEAGDPVQRVSDARSDLESLAARHTVRWWGAVSAHPPAAWPVAQAEDGDPDPDIPHHLANDWSVLTTARLDDSRRDEPPTVWARDEALERRITEAVLGVRPQARVSVWAGPVGVRGWKTRVDVRIAEPGLDEARLEQIGGRLKPLLSGMSWRLSGLDSDGPEIAPRATFICVVGGGRCRPTTARVAPPESLARQQP